MKLLFDHNLSRRLRDTLADEFHGAAHVVDFGLERADDRQVWDFAKEHGYTIVSKDSDFMQMSFLMGAPPQIIWLRVGNSTTNQIEELLRKKIDEVRRFHVDPQASFLVLDRSGSV